MSESAFDRAARLIDIKDREKRATPGIWLELMSDGGQPCIGTVDTDIAWVDEEADAAFLAHARADIPWLIKQYEQADRDRKALLRAALPFVAWARSAGELNEHGDCHWCERTDCVPAAHSTCFGWQARKLLKGWEERNQ